MDTGGTSTIRRWVLLTLALALTTMGIVVPNTLAQAIRQETSPGSQENPDFSASCGTDVVVVLDESGSIQSPGGGQPSAIPEVEGAVQALVAGLNGTGSRMRIVEFSTNARDAQIGPSPTDTDFQVVDDDYVERVNAYLTGGGTTHLSQNPASYNPSQANNSQFYTNWEAALNEAATGGLPIDSGNPNPVADGTPLIVFITDGGPNTIGTNNNGTLLANAGADGTEAGADAAIDEIERLQAAGSHVLSIGVGQASTSTTLFNRLGNLTEPGALQSWTGGGDLDIGTVDIIDAGDFGGGELEGALQKIVFALCGSSLTIHKTDDAGQPIAGRNFDLTIESLSGGAALEWELPADGGQADAPATETVATGADGIANFKWTPGSLADPEPWSSSVYFTETLPPGWGLGAVTCKIAQAAVPNLVVERVGQTVTVGPFTIGRTEAAVCDVENVRPPAIEVVKTAVAVDGIAVSTPPAMVSEHGGDVTYRVDVKNLSQEPLTLTSLVDDVFGNLAGVSASTCAVGGTIAVGATYTCEFTRVVVQPGGPNAPTSHVNTVTGIAVDDEQNEATDSDDETVGYVLVDPVVTITKTDFDARVFEPGGDVVYSITITNPSDAPEDLVAITSLTDTIDYADRDNEVVVDLLGEPGAPNPPDLVANGCPAAIAAALPLAPGQSVPCSFTIALAGTIQEVSDRVDVTAIDIDGDEATSEATESTPIDVVEVYDVGIEKTASGVPGGSLTNGEQFTYTLTVTNHGNVPAVDVVVVDDVPARLRVDDVTVPAGWTNLSSGNAVELGVPTMASGASVDIVLTVSLVPAALPAPIDIFDGQPAPPLPDLAIDSIINEACVSAEVDTDPTNNCADVSVPVDDIVAVVYVRCVNDAPLLGYSVQTTPSLANEDITLTWRPNDPTPQTSPQQVVIDGLRSGDADEIAWPGAVFTADRVSIDWPGWRPIRESDYVNGSLSHHDPLTIFNGMILDGTELDHAWHLGTTVTFSVNPTITFTAGYPDPTPECAAERSADLDIEKTASVSSILAGQSFFYTIDVTNLSEDGAAEPVILTDQIPAQVRVDGIVTSTTAFPRWTDCAVTGRDGEGYGGQLRCELFGALPIGANAPQVRLDVTARPTASGTVVNTGIVTWQLASDPDSPVQFADDAATITVTAVSVLPPVPAAPVLPPTGSSTTEPLLRVAITTVLGGVAILLIAHRRRGANAI